MASTMRSTFAKTLVAVMAISSVGMALAHEGHAHAPAPAPLGDSAAAGLLPATIVTSFITAVSVTFRSVLDLRLGSPLLLAALKYSLRGYAAETMLTSTFKLPVAGGTCALHCSRQVYDFMTQDVGLTPERKGQTMASSTRRSTSVKDLVAAAVVISSIGIAVAHEGHAHAPALAPTRDTAAANSYLQLSSLPSFSRSAVFLQPHASDTSQPKHNSVTYLPAVEDDK
ncbi:hypothetical protein R1sor_022770 [Riccia sorocarpa]|uniref:Uncharacterized protein n=1 Tax=Riccia sorocarpa TaxID=122646 RepID=A0ABD3GN10_9MARC